VAEVLDQRALNRALLARQGLLERLDRSPVELIEHLVGVQAQLPNAPYVGLQSRLERFEPDDLASLLSSRAVVRVALMRSTVHLVTARDCLSLRPVIAPVLERQLWGGSQWGKRLAGIDVATLVATGRSLLDERPLTSPELAQGLHERFPDRDGESMANALRNLVPLVQLPPRGIWGVGGVAALATAETWLGAPLATDPAPDQMILRYLGAFGPASVMDVQAWCGLTRLGAVVERLRPQLVCFEDEAGRELFDLPDAPRPDPSTPAPVRFLPEYDNVLLSHADRTRIIAPEQRERVFTRGALLVDGFVRGTWKVRVVRRAATLEIEPFRPIPRRAAAAVEREGARLLTFVAPDARSHGSRIA
jgi:Winged helix DNA-binding domain